MPLLADAICFREPGRHFAIDVVHRLESECVNVISWRNSFDATKTRMLESARQNHVAIHPVPPNHKSGEAHPDLKRDSRFLRENRDRPVPLRNHEQFVEDGARSLRLSDEMRRECISPAGVGLIAIRKEAAATWATPQGCQPFRRLHAFSCLITPAMSTRPHASTACPPVIRQTLKPSILTFLPVGSIPKKAPQCVPSEIQWSMTSSPSATVCKLRTAWSKAALRLATASLNPSRPGR